MREIYAAAENRPETILISSGGGSLQLGLDLAEWILDNRLNVEVGDLCFSACANYVFLAGNIKKLNRNSVVGWHGGAWQESFDRLANPGNPSYAPELVELRERETRFFDRVGVDNLITVHGQEVGVRWRDRLRWLFGARLLGFDYDLGDLRRMGVSDIDLLDGEWSWREHNPEFAARVRRVSLDEDYEFTMNRFGSLYGTQP